MPTAGMVEVQRCPLCTQAHQYPVDVERSAVVHLIPGTVQPLRQASFVRLFTCPIKDETFQAELTTTNGPQVRSVAAISPHNKGLYEAGKKILGDSLDAGRDFCSFMITTSLGAIPVYLALLSLALPKEYKPTASDVRVILPAALFLLATVVFILGFFPRAKKASLDIPSEIEDARIAYIKQRRTAAIVGFFLFALALGLALLTTIWALKVEAAAAAAA
jgi:hypothetical protein